MARKSRKPLRRRAPVASPKFTSRERQIVDRLMSVDERLDEHDQNLQQLADYLKVVDTRIRDDLDRRIRKLEADNFDSPTIPMLARQVLAIKQPTQVNEHFHERLRTIEGAFQRLAKEVDQLRVYGRNVDDRAELERIVKDAASKSESRPPAEQEDPVTLARAARPFREDEPDESNN